MWKQDSYVLLMRMYFEGAVCGEGSGRIYWHEDRTGPGFSASQIYLEKHPPLRKGEEKEIMHHDVP